jgi:hypothetical protein
VVVMVVMVDMVTGKGKENIWFRQTLQM